MNAAWTVTLIKYCFSAPHVVLTNTNTSGALSHTVLGILELSPENFSQGDKRSLVF